MPSRAFQASALTQLLLAIGHTLKAKDFMNTVAFRALPIDARSKSTVGWYQGSGLFLILAVLNLKWSRAVRIDSLDKTAATLMTALLWASGVWYVVNGDKETGAIVGVAGAVQAWAALL